MASKQLKQGVLKPSMKGMRSEKLMGMITYVSLVFTYVVWFLSDFYEEVQCL